MLGAIRPVENIFAVEMPRMSVATDRLTTQVRTCPSGTEPAVIDDSATANCKGKINVATQSKGARIRVKRWEQAARRSRRKGRQRKQLAHGRGDERSMSGRAQSGVNLYIRGHPVVSGGGRAVRGCGRKQSGISGCVGADLAMAHRLLAKLSTIQGRSASASAARTSTSEWNISDRPPATMAPGPLPVVRNDPSADSDEDCIICGESLSFSFRLPGEKPHIVPECGHALHEVSPSARRLTFC